MWYSIWMHIAPFPPSIALDSTVPILTGVLLPYAVTQDTQEAVALKVRCGGCRNSSA